MEEYIMKKTILATVLLSSLVLGATVSLAEEVETDPNENALEIITKGSVTFELDENEGEPPVIVDPEDPEQGIETPGEDVKPPEIIVPDPEDPEKPGKPESGGETNPAKGALKLEFAPHFNFGKQKISAKDMDYKALDFTNGEDKKNLYAQVMDGRDASETGWDLSLKASQFTGEEGKTLPTSITINVGETTINNGFSSPADQGETTRAGDIMIPTDGEATVSLTKGEETQKGRSAIVFSKGVKLHVPAKAGQEAFADVKYQSDLTWTLTPGTAEGLTQGTPETN